MIKILKLLYILIISALFIVSCDDNQEDILKVTNLTLSQQNGELSAIVEAIGEINYYELSFLPTTMDYGADMGIKILLNQDTTLIDMEANGIEPDVMHNFYIRAKALNGATSAWFGPKTLLINEYCQEPYDLHFSGAFYWEYYYNSTDAAYYAVEYGLQGFTPGTGISFSCVDTYTYSLVLETGKTYDFYVKAYCSASLGWSNWVGPLSGYATENLNVCMEPENVGWNVEVNFWGEPVGATFTWLDLGNNPGYEFNLVSNNQSPESNAIESGTSPTITYLSLYQDTEYDFYVRTVCLDGSKTAWVGPLNINIGH